MSAVTMRPSSPSSTAFFVRITLREKRDCAIEVSITPFASQQRTMASSCSVVMAIGFSTTMCLSASAACLTTSA